MPALPVLFKLLTFAFASIGVSKVADNYVKPLLPRQYQYEGQLAPGNIFSIQNIIKIAVGVIAALLVVWVGKTLNIQILKRKI